MALQRGRVLMIVDCACSLSTQEQDKAAEHANELILQGFKVVQSCKCRKDSVVPPAPRTRTKWPAGSLTVSALDQAVSEPLLPITDDACSRIVISRFGGF